MNNALIAEVDAAGHRQALEELLSFWDEKYGPVSAADLEMARAAFAELDGVELSRRMTSAPVLLDCVALSDVALEEERGPS